MYKVIGRHRWVAGAIITESINEKGIRRYVASIRGYKKWKIYQGKHPDPQKIFETVKKIRDAIDKGNQDVFYKKGWWLS